MIPCSKELAPGALNARRIGIIGGSFDPPHLGHLHVARSVSSGRALDHMLWIPAARPPHKPERVLADAPERIEMLQLLLEEESDCSIWTIELDRPGPSYSVDTLRLLRRELDAATEIFLSLGTDNLPGLPRWHEVEEVLALAEPVVVPRPGSPNDPPELRSFSRALQDRVSSGLLSSEVMDVSSTELRALVATRLRGESSEALLPDRLWEYILSRGIYSQP